MSLIDAYCKAKQQAKAKDKQQVQALLRDIDDLSEAEPLKQVLRKLAEGAQGGKRGADKMLG